MAKKLRRSGESKPTYHLPKGSLARIHLGQSFAEYDPLLAKPEVFVQTPALMAALNPGRKCFFVGRRGTGKTAITYYLRVKNAKTTVSILPQMFSPLTKLLNHKTQDLQDTRQQPFKSLMSCFKRALVDEVICEWMKGGLLPARKLPPAISRERNYIQDFDFDQRMLAFVEETFEALCRGDNKTWLRLNKQPKEILNEASELREGIAWDYTLLIDRIDDSWDGSDDSVVLLMALMHSCVEIASVSNCIRPLLFLRENIFERVRLIDNEFSRLETWVVSVDWSRELLVEAIERRINLYLPAKLPLNGTTWDYFFEPLDGQSSKDFVFDYCKERPRDVLIFCSSAIDSAKSARRETVTITDLQNAKTIFSRNRLKDLSDEYSENYPQIQLVLDRFFGLKCKFTVSGIEDFIKMLLLDEEIKQHCKTWIYGYTTPDRFIYLLYGIGFIGIWHQDNFLFRSLGPQVSAPPPLEYASLVEIHPSYVNALELRDGVINSLDMNRPLQKAGLLAELPDAIPNIDKYNDRLCTLQQNLKNLPLGKAGDSEYEEIIGELIQLLFFRSLANVEPKVRDNDGRKIRDWIAANRASSGFWQMILHKYEATQIVWECKNYTNLSASDFHQAAYYMNKAIGRFAVLSFRGERKSTYNGHIKEIAIQKDGGIVLLLTDQDWLTFIRQALNGKVKEDHIQGLFDSTVRLL